MVENGIVLPIVYFMAVHLLTAKTMQWWDSKNSGGYAEYPYWWYALVVLPLIESPFLLIYGLVRLFIILFR